MISHLSLQPVHHTLSLGYADKSRSESIVARLLHVLGNRSILEQPCNIYRVEREEVPWAACRIGPRNSWFPKPSGSRLWQSSRREYYVGGGC